MSTDLEKLRELLARVESAAEPLIELDREIGGILEAALVNIVEPPRYTSSIDAAVALCERVLPGWKWAVRNCSGGPTASVHHGSETPNVWNKTKAARSSTPALAFCAAILRAKIAQLENV